LNEIFFLNANVEPLRDFLTVATEDVRNLLSAKGKEEGNLGGSGKFKEENEGKSTSCL